VGGREPRQLIEQLGLGRVARTRVRRLSGGERQRLALALALVGDPEVLLLDEPTAGMDPEVRRSTRELVAALRDAGRAILMTTHDLGDVERLADRVAILHRGRIVADAAPDALVASSPSVLTFRLHARPERSSLERLDRSVAAVAQTASVVAGATSTAFAIAGPGPTADLTSAVAQWALREGSLIVELRAGAASLEERYLELTGDRDVESVD
jgi:ABC-2 type transport system ATP-binding protein